MRSKLFTIRFPFKVPLVGDHVTIFSYGLMIVVGFLVGVYLARQRATKAGIDPDAIMDLGLCALISGILGARLFYVIQFHGQFFGPNAIHGPGGVLKIWHGGLVFYGGFIAAAAAIYGFIRWKRLPLLKVLDIIAPCAILGLAFGRIGCFLNGCCYGHASGLPWAVVFPDDAIPYQAGPQGFPPGTALHPTQVYSCLNALLIFVVLSLYYERAARPEGRRRDGEVVILLCMLYPIGRSIIEFFRADTAVEHGLTVSQTISVVVFLAAAVALFLVRFLPASATPSRGSAPKPDGRPSRSSTNKARK